MEVYRTSDPIEALRLSEECLAGHEGLIVHVTDSIFVETGAFPTCSTAVCAELGIPVCKAGYLGGSIVCFPGDVSLCEISWGNSSFAPDTVDRAEKWLRDKGLTVTRDGNDVLVDDRKVISWARATTLQGWCQSVVHFSVSSDEELIRKICTKEMVKRPGALSNYGITAGDILEVALCGEK